MRPGVPDKYADKTFGRCPVMCRFLGRLHHKTIHALLRQASEKREGTKSRAERGGFAAAIYGDLRSARVCIRERGTTDALQFDELIG